MAALLDILLQAARRPIRGNHQIERPLAEPFHVLGNGERDVLFGEQAKDAAIRVVAARRRSGKQQHAGGIAHAGIVLLVGGGPLEDRFRRFVRLPVLQVERPIHFEGEGAAVGHVLPHAQRNLLARDGRKAPPEVHELHVEIHRQFSRLAVERAIHVVAGGVRPERKRPPHRGIGLRHDAVGVLLHVVEVAGVRPLLADQLADGLGDLAGAGQEEFTVIVVGAFRDLAGVQFAIPVAAGIAVAEADICAAVIGGLVAEHIEEQAVHVVSLQSFAEDLHRLTAIVSAVDAGGIEAVVNDRAAICLTEEPLGMGIVSGLLRLAQIVAAHDSDAAGVRLFEDVAKHVAARRQVRTRIMEVDARRVVRGDAAHTHEDHIGAHVGELGDEAVGIHGGVRFPQVGLHPTDGLGGPPSGLSGQQVGRKEEDGETRLHC